MDGQDGGQDAALCRGGATLNSAFFLPPFSWVPGKIMENRGNRETILPQRPQRSQPRPNPDLPAEHADSRRYGIRILHLRPSACSAGKGLFSHARKIKMAGMFGRGPVWRDFAQWNQWRRLFSDQNQRRSGHLGAVNATEAPNGLSTPTARESPATATTPCDTIVQNHSFFGRFLLQRNKEHEV